jgi:hypothetical protein
MSDNVTPNELAHELWSHLPEHEYEVNRAWLINAFHMLKIGGIWAWPETQRIFKKTSDEHLSEVDE